MRSPLPLSLSTIAFIALTLTACAVADEESTPEEPSTETAETTTEDAPAPEETADAPEEDVYVTQITTMEGDDGEYYSAHRPDELTLTEFTNAFDLTWQTWGPDTAVASGLISGSWCWDDCQDGYEATIVLCDVNDDHFVRFGVFGDFPGYAPEDTQFGSPLYFSGIEYSDAEWYGCEEP